MLYMGSTDRPDVRVAELEHRAFGRQPKFCKACAGLLQFRVLYRGLSKSAAACLEAKVTADLAHKHKANSSKQQHTAAHSAHNYQNAPRRCGLDGLVCDASSGPSRLD